MIRFLFWRALLLVPTLIGITLVSFGFIRLLPGDPVVLMAGERSLTPERHAELLKQFGFDRPVWEQYLHYVWDLLHGDLGVSLKTKMPVLQEFLTLFPATVELSLAAMLFAVVLGIPAGVIAAVRRGSVCLQERRTLNSNPPPYHLAYSLPHFHCGLPCH